MSQSYMSFGHRLPKLFSKPLFGDRRRYGLRPDDGDSCWKIWSRNYTQVMAENKGFSISNRVYHSSYRHVARLNVTGKRLAEIGPGDMAHLQYFNGSPAKMDLVDIDRSMLELAYQSALDADISCNMHCLEQSDDPVLPLENGSVDVFLSFFVFEHVLPLSKLLSEIRRVLAPDGVLLGSIPCEGGLSWGLGRYLTTRRRYRALGHINFDKIICWEHPNFAVKVLADIGREIPAKWIKLWPLGHRLIDINLTATFFCTKADLAEGD